MGEVGFPWAEACGIAWCFWPVLISHLKIFSLSPNTNLPLLLIKRVCNRGECRVSRVEIPGQPVRKRWEMTSVLGMDECFPCSSSKRKYYPITVIPTKGILYECHQGQWWLSCPALVMVILFPLLLPSVPQSSVTPLRCQTSQSQPSHPPAYRSCPFRRNIVGFEHYHNRGSLRSS